MAGERTAGPVEQPAHAEQAQDVSAKYRAQPAPHRERRAGEKPDQRQQQGTHHQVTEQQVEQHLAVSPPGATHELTQLLEYRRVQQRLEADGAASNSWWTRSRSSCAIAGCSAMAHWRSSTGDTGSGYGYGCRERTR